MHDGRVVRRELKLLSSAGSHLTTLHPLRFFGASPFRFLNRQEHVYQVGAPHPFVPAHLLDTYDHSRAEMIPVWDPMA